jgi:hypothetical protein
MFSIARCEITEFIIASVFVSTLENLWAISESGNIVLNRTDAQSAVL